MNYRTKDRLAVIGGVLFIALVVTLIPLGIWLHVAAPCKYVDWMPAKDVPTRCLSIEERR